MNYQFRRHLAPRRKDAAKAIRVRKGVGADDAPPPESPGVVVGEATLALVAAGLNLAVIPYAYGANNNVMGSYLLGGVVSSFLGFINPWVGITAGGINAAYAIKRLA